MSHPQLWNYLASLLKEKQEIEQIAIEAERSSGLQIRVANLIRFEDELAGQIAIHPDISSIRIIDENRIEQGTIVILDEADIRDVQADEDVLQLTLADVEEQILAPHILHAHLEELKTHIRQDYTAFPELERTFNTRISTLQSQREQLEHQHQIRLRNQDASIRSLQQIGQISHTRTPKWMSLGATLSAIIGVSGLILAFINTDWRILGSALFIFFALVIPIFLIWQFQTNNSRLQRLDVLQQQRQQIIHAYQQQLAQIDQLLLWEDQQFNIQLSELQVRIFQQNLPKAQALIQRALQQVTQEIAQVYPDWSAIDSAILNADYILSLARSVSRGVRFGVLHQDSLTIPMFIDPIGQQQHTWITEGSSEQRIQLLQTLLVRLLLIMPPGMIRISLIDADEQGHALRLFASLLPEAIRGEKALDSERDIAEQIVKMRERISQINQHVLVEHQNLELYNANNPDMPATYQILVINNFPQGFNESALRALQDIIRNGPRAGTYILATVARQAIDERRNINFVDMNTSSVVLSFNGGALRWANHPLSDYLIANDSPPPQERIVYALRLIREIYDSTPTKIPYDRVRREFPALWSVPTDEGLSTLVGLTFGGKLHKILFNDQFVHGLIGGRPGSGKTVLLHNLICGLVQMHHWSDLSLYLLDFKGTEFNVYAKHNLRHARIVAVDCDPEVGLSVINELVAEIGRRRVLFDNAGVEDLQNYRRKQIAKLPRILLIIDEIQMLTQQSDISLVRQISAGLTQILRLGRFVGIHLLLATQSPTNVLTSEMMQQIAIRICLQSDQQVSRLVLGDTNEAASALERVGEAVFNGFNGVAAQNVLIRTAALTREEIVALLGDLKRQESLHSVSATSDPMRYFDGQSRMYLVDHEVVKEALENPELSALPTSLTVPVGNAIEIKPNDTSVPFIRQRFGNLLLVGSDIHAQELYGLLLNVVSGLCIMCPSSLASFSFIDLSNEQFSDQTHHLQTMPHLFEFARNSLLGSELVMSVHEQFIQRKAEAREKPHVGTLHFIIIHGMENFGDMRGVDRFDKPPVRKAFEDIVKDGPLLGVHTIVATQTLARGEVVDPREFGLRLCFNIAPEDSDTLIGRDIGQLREQRAIFRRYDWAAGRVEKFKPYVPLDVDMLRTIAQKLRQRAER